MTGAGRRMLRVRGVVLAASVAIESVSRGGSG
jgi:hypothetical protein